MSGVLQSLLNPLDMQTALPATMDVRRDFTAATIGDQTYWSATVQYFLNDVVFSPVNQGAYVMIGGPTLSSSVRGGAEPSASPDFWAPLTQYGAATKGGAPLLVTVTAGAGGAIALTGGSATTGWGEGQAVLVTVQGIATGAASPMTAASWLKWAVTASGSTSVSQTHTVVPDTTSGLMGFSFSCVVKTGTSTPAADQTITLTVSADPTTPAVLTACYATYMPLA